MSVRIPDAFRDLFEKQSFAHLVTLMPDGGPQVSPVWCDSDGTHVLINSARGRQKDKNMERDPRVALSIQDPTNPYRYLEVRGRVVEITQQGAEAHIDRLAKRYMGVDEYPLRKPGEARVIYKILPEKVNTMG